MCGYAEYQRILKEQKLKNKFIREFMKRPTPMEWSRHFMRHHMFWFTKSGAVPTRIIRFWAKGYDYRTAQQESGTLKQVFELAYRYYMFNKGEYKFGTKISQEQFNKLALSGKWIVTTNKETGKTQLINRDRQPVLYIEPEEYERLYNLFGIYVCAAARSRGLFRCRMDRLMMFDFDHYPDEVDLQALKLTK